MPQAIAEVEQMDATVGWQRLAVLAEIGDVVEAGREPRILRLDDVAAARILALAEIQRKRHLLLVGNVLAVKHQHGVSVHAGFDISRLVFGQRFGEIYPGDFAGKMTMQLLDLNGHGVFPGRRAVTPRLICEKATLDDS